MIQSSTEEYYRTQSPKNFILDIKVPFLAINAQDDPIAGACRIPLETPKLNPNVVFAITRHGGHLGWFVGPFSFITKKRWVVKPVIEWLRALHEADPIPKKHKAISQVRTPKVGDEMVLDPEDDQCGFKEVDADIVTYGDNENKSSLLSVDEVLGRSIHI